MRPGISQGQAGRPNPRLSFALLQLDVVDLADEIDETRNVLVAIAAAERQHESLMHGFGDEGGNREVFGHIRIIAQILGGVADRELADESSSASGTWIRRSNINRFGTPGHHDIAQGRHIDACPGGGGDPFGDGRGGAESDEVIDELQRIAAPTPPA